MTEDLCVNMLTQVQWPQKPEASESSGAGVTGDFEPPQMNAGRNELVSSERTHS